MAPCASLRMAQAFERLSSNPRLHQYAARSQNYNICLNKYFLSCFSLVLFRMQLDLKFPPFFSTTKQKLLSFPGFSLISNFHNFLIISVSFFIFFNKILPGKVSNRRPSNFFRFPGCVFTILKSIQSLKQLCYSR